MTLISDIERYTLTDIRPERIDSRDLITAREEAMDILAADEAEDDDIEVDDDERADLEAIIAEVDELEGCCEDWLYGASLIRQDRFVDYAQELAEDIYPIAHYAWPYTCIDWDKAADDLLVDYTTVTIDGESYYAR